MLVFYPSRLGRPLTRRRHAGASPGLPRSVMVRSNALPENEPSQGRRARLGTVGDSRGGGESEQE
jgi:hypothetical protein